MAAIPREVLKWLLGLDLSYPVKNPKRDFANGFLYAEVLSRYYPADVQMHSFENVASTERKKMNWSLLEKLFKKKGIPVDKPQITAVMSAEGDAAVEVLIALYGFIHSPSYEASKEGASRSSPDELGAARDRGYDASVSQPDFIPTGYGYEGHAAMSVGHEGQAYAQGVMPMYFGGGGHQQQQYAYAQQQGAMANGVNGYAYMQQQQQQQQQAEYAAQMQAAQAGYAAQLQQQQQAGYAAQMQAAQQQQQQGGGYAGQAQSKLPSRGVRSGQPKAAPAGQRQPPQQQVAAAAAGGDGGYAVSYAANAYAEQMRQQAAAAGYTPDQQQLVFQQALYQHQQASIAHEGSSYAGGGGGQSPEQQALPFSKQRPVDFKPYDMKDFEQKDYNIKGGKGYWQLGKLGPDLETEELQAKREAKERQRKQAAEVREENLRRAASRSKQRPAAASPAKEPTARERAKEFAKNIPKPEPKPKPKSNSGDRALDPDAERAVESELVLLERQHEERQQEVDRIRAELARML